MYKIAKLNKISPVGLARLTDDYEITENVNEADGILVRSADMLTMEFSPVLKAVARAGAGVNNIPLDRCAEQGIVVFNTPGANANAVKELVICGMLMAMRNVPAGLEWAKGLAPNEEMDVAKQVEKGKSKYAGHEIFGKTLGVVGLGAIGRKIAEACSALGMDIVGYDPFVTECEGVKVYTDLKEMLAEADIVTLHLPANDATKKMINADVISAMKDGVLLLNFSRDKLVNEDDLLAALESGKVSQYVCDFPNDHMVGKPGVILTPHLGASSAEAEDNCAEMAVKEIRDYFEDGNIINSVNFPKLDMGQCTSPRVAMMVKGMENPVAEVMDMFSELKVPVVKAMASMRKDGISYVLAELDKDSFTSAEEVYNGLNVENSDKIMSARFIGC
ncbi:MAG: 3-phosphoglycerate dehydrogenase [Firmicutes bacterium]|nr:3-phosphoglycerate dehydrogenase [Bacillota bacterium]